MGTRMEILGVMEIKEASKVSTNHIRSDRRHISTSSHAVFEVVDEARQHWSQRRLWRELADLPYGELVQDIWNLVFQESLLLNPVD